MVRKSFVKIVMNPPYFSDECAKVGGRKLWIQLNTGMAGRGQNRTMGDLAKIIQEKFQLPEDIRLTDQNGYVLQDELDFAVVNDVKFGQSCILVWPARKYMDYPTGITEALSTMTPLALHSDPGTPALAARTTKKRKHQNIHQRSSNDVDLDSGMSDGGDDEEDKFSNESSKTAAVDAAANEDGTRHQADNKKPKLDLADAALRSPLMEDLTEQESGLAIPQEFAASPNWKILERASDICGTTVISFIASSLEDLTPDSNGSGTRLDTPYPKDINPWGDANRRRLTFGEELQRLDKDSKMEDGEESGTPNVQGSVIALAQDDTTACSDRIIGEEVETAVMNLDVEKHTEELNKDENSMEIHDQEEQSEMTVTRKEPVDERHENLWTVSFRLSEFTDSLELDKSDSF